MNKQAGRPAYNPGFNNGNGGGGASSVMGELGFLFGRDHGYPDPDPNPPPRVVLFGPWDGLQTTAPPVQPELHRRTCTSCQVEMLAAYFLMPTGGYFATCAQCRARRTSRRRAVCARRAMPPVSPPSLTATRTCTHCRKELPLAKFVGVGRRGEQAQYVTCTTCRLAYRAYEAARHATAATGGTSDGR